MGSGSSVGLEPSKTIFIDVNGRIEKVSKAIKKLKTNIVKIGKIAHKPAFV